MSARGLSLTTATYNIIMKSLARADKFDKLLEVSIRVVFRSTKYLILYFQIFQYMQRLNVKPNALTYMIVINVCCPLFQFPLFLSCSTTS